MSELPAGLIEGAIVLSEQKADVSDARHALRPALPPLQALRYNIPKFYERMVRLTQVMGAGGILANPTEADLKSEIAADIHRYYKGADRDAEAKIRLSKLAWDATGTQFGQRQLQYERYYARRSRCRPAAAIYHAQDHSAILAAVERALKLPREREFDERNDEVADLGSHPGRTACRIRLRHAASAQNYPSRPVTVIAPFPPGGSVRFTGAHSFHGPLEAAASASQS